MSNDTDPRCTSTSEDGRRCHGDVGHAGTHWAAASRVWSDTETLVRPPPTLTDFLLARFAEDEAQVELAIEADPAPSGWIGSVREALEVNRRLLSLASSYSPELEHGDNGDWAFDAMKRTLAASYADHSDYRDEWRP